MFRSLAPLLGCGVMMLVCMAMMGMAGRKRTDQSNPTGSSEEVAALRDEVARLRALDEQRRATSEGPTP